MPKFDEYLGRFPEPTREKLRAVRRAISETAPEATETFSYGIPTFDLDGTHLVHFAAFAHHIGFYPTSSGIEAFREELAPYATSRGTVRFPLEDPLPLDLIRRITAFRVSEVTGSVG